MPGNQLAVIRNNQAYMGWGKQVNWGAPVAPTNYWRWLGGSDINPDARVQFEREGDTSVYESFAYKQGEWWIGKIVEYVRPITAGCAIQAFLGTGSDTLTAASASGALNAPVAVGATSFTTVATIGNVGASVPFAFTPGYASTVAEVRLVNLAGRTGVGPYTYPLAAGDAFLFAHNTSDVVINASTHTFARTNQYDPYSLEIGYGTAAVAPFDAFRVQDCVAYALDLEFEAGKPIKMTHSWYGIKAQRMNALSTPSYEGTGLVQNGACGRPLLMYDAGTTWRINALGTGNAATIVKGKISLKNSTAAEDIQNELLTPSYFIPSNIEISGDLEVHFSNFAQYYQTYYGSAAPAVSATDSYLVGNESFNVTWASDGINSLAVSLPSITYMAAKLTPNLDAKVLRQPITFKAQKTPANPAPLSLVLSNTQNVAY